MKYSAVVRVPAALTALMSAVPLDETSQGWWVGGADEETDLPPSSEVTADPPHRGVSYICMLIRSHSALMSAGVDHLSDVFHAGATRLFAFEQNVPIPPYLLALAVGHLESRELSNRQGNTRACIGQIQPGCRAVG